MQINKLAENDEIRSGIISETLKNDVKPEIKTEIKTGSIGESGNKNIRTRFEAKGDIATKVKDGTRELSAFKDKAKSYKDMFESNKEAMSAQVLSELNKEGINSEKTDADIVKKSIENILEKREIRKEQLASQIEKKVENREKTEKSGAYREGADASLAERLEASGLAVTKENIEKLSSAIKTADETIKSIDDGAIKRIIEGGFKETVHDIYKAEHSTAKDEEIESDEALWESVKEQAKERLVSEGVKDTKESEIAAKWLFNRGLPVTPENTAKYLSLNELKTEAGKENAKTEMIKAMAKGKEPLSAEIGTANIKTAGYAVAYFKFTAERKINVNDVSTRRNLEEIRLKLTEEAAVKMLRKGIKIDVSDLKGLVENLRKEENEYYENLLEKAEKESVTAESKGTVKEERATQIELLRNTISIRTFAIEQKTDSEYKYLAVSYAYKEENRISLSEYHKAGLAYEKGATEIRTDLGDSIKKAFGNIDEVLKSNGLDITEENKKAVRMLAYNRTEITGENVVKMKTASLLTEEVLNELKPATVARLIKDGKNPLDMDMKDLLNAAKEINIEEKTADERYSAYLYKAETMGEITETEREAYIGIYRLLNQIEKSDGASEGGVSLSERSMTLRNLLNSARTLKLNGFDKKIDDTFGEIESLYGGNGIDTRIEAAYGKLLEGKLMRRLSDEDEAYFKKKEAELKTKLDINEDDIENLLDAGAKINIENLMAQNEIGKGRRNLLGLISFMTAKEKEDMNNLSERLLSHFDSEDAVLKNEKKLAEALNEKSEKLINSADITATRLTELIHIKRTVSLSSFRTESESYDIPFVYDGDKLADLSVTVRKSTSENEKGKFRLSLTLEEGSINAEFRLTGDRISGFFKADYREAADRLKTADKELKTIFENENIKIGEISYHLGANGLQIKNFDDIYKDGVKTSEVYKCVKAVATHVLKVMSVRTI